MNTHERQLLEVLADDRMGDPAQSALVKKLLGEFDEVVTALDDSNGMLELLVGSYYDNTGAVSDQIKENESVLTRAKGKPEVDREKDFVKYKDELGPSLPGGLTL